MELLQNDHIFDQMNQLGADRIPFLFIISFDKSKGTVLPLNAVPPDIKFQINKTKGDSSRKILLNKLPIGRATYQKQFEKVQKNIGAGKASVVNLTCTTSLTSDYTLEDIFEISVACYKLFVKDCFVCFSPETFIKIEHGIISSYPMKGTMDSAAPNAKEMLLKDQKEIKEHAEVVNMMTEDLLRVAKDVAVARYRYVEEIKTADKTLLQTSTEIKGALLPEYKLKLGSLFEKLLPAASICGYPRAGALEIIEASESHQRNFYTGVFGVFDGQKLDSGVLIRFIEKTHDGLVYKSGGGITAESDCDREYREMTDKIYVPIN